MFKMFQDFILESSSCQIHSSDNFPLFCAKQSRYTSEALHSYLSVRAEKGELLTAFLETLLQQFATYQKVDRVTLPLIRTVGDLLSSSAVLDSVSIMLLARVHQFCTSNHSRDSRAWNQENKPRNLRYPRQTKFSSPYVLLSSSSKILKLHKWCSYLMY